MLKYLWTGIICTPDFLKSLQRRLAFIDMNRDHSQSGISEWKKKKKFTFWCHHVWTMCEHCCLNIHLWIASLNAIVPCMCMHKASLSTSTSTSTLPLAYHHVSPSVNNVWTMCEHASTNCFFKCYCTLYVHVQSKFIYIYIYIYTATCISPCVTICEQCVNTTVWTSIYQLFL